MRKLLILTAAASLLAGGTALAGLNPEFPMLPAADAYGLTGIANNYASAMCVDCHSRIPQVSGGTHFVTATANSDTRSSGGWAAGASNTIAQARLTTEAGGYFQYKATSDWGTGLYSKYGNATGSAATLRSVIVPGSGMDVGDATLNPDASPIIDTAAADYWTSIEGPAAPGAALDIVCESCHNVINNVAGGNNLLAPVSDSATWAVADATEATICVGCHGFMYSANNIAASGQPAPSAHGDVNWTDARNVSTGTTKRGNAESHWIQGLEYGMNHHVMVDDQINAAKIGDGYAWRDVTSFSLADAAMSPASAAGQYPVDGNWAPDKEKTTTGGFNCLNCHTAGHGMQNGVVQAPASAGASILIDVTADIGGVAGDAATVIERIGEGARDWMSIADTGYCNNCHHLPGAAALTP